MADSEAETEQRMYQAMAAMEENTQNRTAAQISQGIAQQFVPPVPESPLADETVQNMEDYTKEHASDPIFYVVRGARLHCEFGSHRRRLNLPRCHGVYVLQKPQIHQMDCVSGVEGANINITSFGICSSPDKSDGENIRLVCEAAADGTPSEETISGIRCIPKIVGHWESTQEDAKIGAEQQPAVITKSFLVCAYGGLIEIVTSGQEFD